MICCTMPAEVTQIMDTADFVFFCEFYNVLSNKVNTFIVAGFFCFMGVC